MAYKRKPFKHQMHVTRRADYPTMSEASAAKPATATLFYERGFFGLVWFENGTRKVRDLKNW